VSQDLQLPPQVVDSLILREQLSRAGRLLRGTVHNLSGALQTLRLPLDLLEMQLMKGGAQDLDGKLGALQQGVSRLGDELNLLAALSQQLQRREAEVIDLGELAREQMDFWRADMFFKHEAQVKADLPQPGLKVRAAYTDTAMALNVLIANATESLQPTEERGLEIALVQEGGQAVLRVTDDGPGPPPELAQTMFQPFVGGKKPEHDGLGLFLARAALSRWEGEVVWAGNPPGAFDLRLPRLAD
jgi:C4-dicarboxylate-specific signal transduction histidine kinase